MSDRYWNRQQQQQQPPPPTQSIPPSAGGMLKRPRTEYDLPPSDLASGHEMHNYYPRGDDYGISRGVNDTKTIGSAYDRYLQSAVPSLTSGEASTYAGGRLGRPISGGMPALPLTEPSAVGRSAATGVDRVSNGRDVGFGGRPPIDSVGRPIRETAPLPPDASNTLYVEGLPSDSTKREVSHIFRPFVGYKEVRLVIKESKHRGGDPLILCFVDFVNPACAATAMSALQGYKMDENDPDSNYLRLQFSRNPGPRPGGYPPRGRR